jgi:phenylpyruvate tautomerase PptA (4-oxalocrotonate tautomerase family)
MPMVKIEIFKGKTEKHKKAIIEGVHSALVNALKLPDSDRIHRIYELDPENFEAAPPKTDNYTIIEITTFKGLSKETKKKLFKAIADNLGKDPGIGGMDITIVLYEPQLENWGIRGGKLASEVDLDYDINI